MFILQFMSLTMFFLFSLVYYVFVPVRTKNHQYNKKIAVCVQGFYAFTVMVTALIYIKNLLMLIVKCGLNLPHQ